MISPCAFDLHGLYPALAFMHGIGHRIAWLLVPSPVCEFSYAKLLLIPLFLCNKSTLWAANLVRAYIQCCWSLHAIIKAVKC